MSLVPRLPETAPFPPAQRAWLDGFIAGLFGGVDDPPDAAPAQDELPWHDPTSARAGARNIG
jgi:sulfite reductase (NADPH) flavoprotein alpha-component